MTHWHDQMNPSPHFAITCTDEAGWIEPLRVIYDHELIMVRAGYYRIEIDNIVHELGPDEYIIIPPGEWHVISGQADAGGIRECIHFDWTGTQGAWGYVLHCFHPCIPEERLYRRSPMWIPQGLMTGSAPVACSVLFQRVESRARSKNAHQRSTARALLLELLLELFNAEDHNAPEEFFAHRSIPHQAREVLQTLVQLPVSKTPSLEQSLAVGGYTYSHVCRCFKRQFGMTPSAYMTTLRMNRAKELLHRVENSLSEIALQVGYEDSAYFSRIFRKHFGQSPRAYRRTLV